MAKNETRVELENKVKDYNEALMNELPLRDLDKIKVEIDEIQKKYQEECRTEVFIELRKQDDPMLEAVKLLTYKTLATRLIDNDGVMEMVIKDANKNINLARLHNFCSGIGKNKSWIHIVKKLNYLLAIDVTQDINACVKDVNDSYEMADIVRQIDLGKTPTSKTNMLKTLGTIVTAMIGEEYKPKSHDVNFLIRAYTRKDNGARKTIKVMRDNNFIDLIADVCNRIVTNGEGYGISGYNPKKNK